MEKWMVVYLLPLEVWMDIFCFPWISRANFGQFVDKIGNFKFAEHAQFFLHEWGKHSLGKLHFDEKSLWRYVNDDDDDEEILCLDIPQTPLPENIKSFGLIRIMHFDAKTLEFLDKIRPLLIDVELQLSASPDCLEETRTVLTNLLPFLNEIHSLNCEEVAFSLVRQCFSGEQLAKLKLLKLMQYYSQTYGKLDAPVVQENVNFVMHWLIHNDANAGLKVCIDRLYYNDNGFSELILTAIREQFVAAKNPRTFAMDLIRLSQAVEFHLLENDIGEELHGVWTDDRELGRLFQITRHLADSNTEELQERIGAITKERHCGHIWISDPSIGSLDADQMAVPIVVVEEEGEEQQQQPCSSKDV